MAIDYATLTAPMPGGVQAPAFFINVAPKSGGGGVNLDDGLYLVKLQYIEPAQKQDGTDQLKWYMGIVDQGSYRVVRREDGQPHVFWAWTSPKMGSDQSKGLAWLKAFTGKEPAHYI